jgi:branched-subunit amino acid aminotransferase/4-amino-4-deoxychorismate lyase
MLIIIGENLHPAPRRFASALRRKVIFLGQLMLQAADKGTLMELMPLADVNGQRIGRGKVTERLMQAYKETVVKETKQGA